jgi:hypothetical protein
MKRLFVLALVIILCGCNALTQRTKDAADSSEVVEVPDEVWQRVQKKIEDRAKAEAAKKEALPGAKQNQEGSSDARTHRAPAAADKRR